MKMLASFTCSQPLNLPRQSRFGARATSPRHAPSIRKAIIAKSPEYDVVVVGSGLGGLAAAAVSSVGYGLSVAVLEAHTIAGGCAHGFQRRTERGVFQFDSGPSLFSGLAGDASSSNPLMYVLKAAGVDLPVVRYDAWGCFFENKYVVAPMLRSKALFSDLMNTCGGPNAASEIAALVEALRPLSAATTAIPSTALRFGDNIGTARALLRYLKPSMIGDVPTYLQLSKPFGPLLKRYVRDEFAYNFMDLLCFLLAGVRADDIVTAEVAFMFSEWTGSTAGDTSVDQLLEFPVGGSGAIVDALVQAIEQSNTGSIVRLGARVKRIILENDVAVGVELVNGERINARRAVMSNASVWDTAKLLPPSSRQLATKAMVMKKLDSFVHLHLALDMTDSDVDLSSLQLNYIFVDSWAQIDAPQNVVVLTIPTVADPSLAPSGHIILHAYTPATEPYDLYKNMDRKSEEYRTLKKQRCEVLWKAIEKVIPDARGRVHVDLEGTPLTHERFLNIVDGSYGPSISAKDGMFPSADLAGVDKLFCVGQSVFPGIGVPAVAASGFAAANSLVPVDKQLRLLEKIGL